MFHIGDVLERSWQLLREQPGLLIVSFIIFWGIIGTAATINQVVVMLVSFLTQDLLWTLVAAFGFQLVVMVLQVFLTLGLIGVVLSVVRGKPGTFADLFTMGGKVVQGVIATLLITIVATIGFICLIIPGIHISLRLMFTMGFIVDRDLDALTAMQASWDCTRGHTLQLFLLTVVVFSVINLVGLLSFGVGLLITTPLCALSLGLIYVLLSDAAANKAANQVAKA